jgi:hypothetical protein
MKFRWFYLQGATLPLNHPSNIQGMDRLVAEFRLFDIFVHAYYPAAGHSSTNSTTQLWVWGPSGSSGALSWKPITVGYICPGPGGLRGRHLVMKKNTEPSWVTESTVNRRYRSMRSGLYSTTSRYGDSDDSDNEIDGADVLMGSVDMTND